MSNIRDTDLVLVSRSGTHYKCPASDLSNKLRDGDYLLVSRSGTHYKVSGADVNNIRDTDTLLISRGNTPYKVTGAVFRTLLGTTWGVNFTGLTNWQAYDIVPNHLGEVFVIGDNNAPSTSHPLTDILVYKVNADGSVGWQKEYTVHKERGVQGCAASNGDIVFASLVDGGINMYVSVIRANRSNGNIVNQRDIWKDVGVSYNRNAYPYDIVPLNNGKFLLTAQVYVEQYNIILNSDLTYSSGWYNTEVSQKFGLTVDSSNNYVYSAVEIIDGKRCGVVLKTDLSGNVSWAKKFCQPNKNVRPTDIKMCQGNPVIVGSDYGTYMKVFVMKWNTSGSLQWYRTISNTNSSVFYTFENMCACDSDGNIYVAIRTGVSDLGVVKFNSSGTHQWTRSFTYSDGTSPLYLRSINVNNRDMLNVVVGTASLQLSGDGNWTGTKGNLTIGSSITGLTIGNVHPYTTIANASFTRTDLGNFGPQVVSGDMGATSRNYSHSTFSI